MTTYTINILKQDLPYVLEAIRMRGHAIADSIAGEVFRIEAAEIAHKKQEESTWVVTAHGDNTIATLKTNKNVKRKPEGGYGLKKDGTPRKRPGRPRKA